MDPTEDPSDPQTPDGEPANPFEDGPGVTGTDPDVDGDDVGDEDASLDGSDDCGADDDEVADDDGVADVRESSAEEEPIHHDEGGDIGDGAD